MELSPDEAIVFYIGTFGVNATIVFTWAVMALLTIVSIYVTHTLKPDVPPDRWRTTLETGLLR